MLDISLSLDIRGGTIDEPSQRLRFNAANDRDVCPLSWTKVGIYRTIAPPWMAAVVIAKLQPMDPLTDRVAAKVDLNRMVLLARLGSSSDRSMCFHPCPSRRGPSSLDLCGKPHRGRAACWPTIARLVNPQRHKRPPDPLRKWEKIEI